MRMHNTCILKDTSELYKTRAGPRFVHDDYVSNLKLNWWNGIAWIPSIAKWKALKEMALKLVFSGFMYIIWQACNKAI